MADILPKVIGGAILAAILLTIILVSISLKKLDSDEVGLKYNTVQKELSKKPSYEGLHNGSPGFTFIIFPSVFETLTFNFVKCLNKDGVQISLDISYQYRVRGNNLQEIISQFRDHDTFKVILEALGESAIHDACSKFDTAQFQSERGAFQEELRARLVVKYDQVATDITDLQVNNIRRPREYEQAVKNKESYREDIEVAHNERPKYLTEAETKKLEAETQANITLAKAQSDARIKESQAHARAEGILNDYKKEAESYKTLISSNGLNLNTEAFLAYVGVRAIEEAQNTVYVGLKSPAKSSWLNPDS